MQNSIHVHIANTRRFSHVGLMRQCNKRILCVSPVVAVGSGYQWRVWSARHRMRGSSAGWTDAILQFAPRRDPRHGCISSSEPAHAARRYGSGAAASLAAEGIVHRRTMVADGQRGGSGWNFDAASGDPLFLTQPAITRSSASRAIDSSGCCLSPPSRIAQRPGWPVGGPADSHSMSPALQRAPSSLLPRHPAIGGETTCLAPQQCAACI